MTSLRLHISVTAFLLAGLSQAEPSEDLRLLTYNIHMWEPGVKGLSAVIKESNADIVALNESWNGMKNDALAKELGYNIVYGGQNTSPSLPQKAHWINKHYMPQVLLTKHRIVSSTFFNAKAAEKESNSPDLDPKVPVYRGALLAELETKNGNRIIVCVLHLHPWGNADNGKMTSMRLAEIQGIVSKLKLHADKPILIMGDFNTRSHLDGLAKWEVTPYLESALFFDLYRSVHTDSKSDPGLTCGDGRIDYIFHNKHVTPLESQVVKKGVFGSKGYDASDHLGVFGTVRIGK